MSSDFQNQPNQPIGFYYACGGCGRWQRASAVSGELKCKRCGSREKLPDGALEHRVPFSHYDAGLRQHNLKLTTGRFRFLCPECGKGYEFPLSLESRRVICPKCRTVFKPKSYMEDHDDGGGETSASRQPPAGPAVHQGRTGIQDKICAYDHTPIEGDDEWVECPACGLPYHRECWEENFGCAALGCAMADALKPGGDQDQSQSSHEELAPLPPPPPPPRERGRGAMLMGVSGVAVLPGLLTFGLPNLITCGISVFLIARRKPGTQYGWLFLAFLISLIAFWGGFWCTLYLFGG